MNLRLPIAAAVVAVAAGAAAFRAAHRDPSPPFASSGPTGVAATAAPEPPRPLRVPPVPEPVARVTVYVAGDVAHPGVYALRSGSRAVDALRAAGGAAPDADPVAVNLAEPLLDGQEIVVPVKGSAAAAEADAATAADGADASASTVSHRHRAKKRRHKHRKHRSHRHAAASSVDDGSTSDDATSTSDAAVPPTAVDLNTADENELETLPGIGASLASRIVAFRAINGAFVSTDDLLDVGGMTQGRLDEIAPYVTIR